MRILIFASYNGSLPLHFAAYSGNVNIFDLINNRSKISELTETDQQGNV